MPTASGSRVQLTYIPEVTHGTTPATPAMTVLRNTGRNINPTKQELVSAEVRSDRQTAVVRHGFKQIDGSIPFELALAAYDAMLEAALASAFAVAHTQVTDVSVDTTSTFDRASGSFITDGYRIGDIIITAGFADSANNGQFRITAVSALVVTVDATLVTEVTDPAQTMDLVGERMDVGTTLTTFTMERQFIDITQYQVFTGVAVNTMDFSIQPNAIATASMTLLGMSGGTMSGSSVENSQVAAATNSPMDAFAGELYEGLASVAVVTGIDFSINNQREVRGVVGQSTSPDVYEGICEITGTITIFLQDGTLYSKFLDETESSLWVRLDDPDTATSFLNFVFPRVKYSAGDIDPPGSGPVTISMPFRALYDATAGTSMTIQRSNS